MSESFSFDVFLSHSSKDEEIVRAIAERLRADGLRVWFDAWELGPGDSIPAKIEEGLELSQARHEQEFKFFRSGGQAWDIDDDTFPRLRRQDERFLPALFLGKQSACADGGKQHHGRNTGSADFAVKHRFQGGFHQQ